MPDNDFEYDTPEEFLAHFGVKGMKWGVRRDAKGFSERQKGAELDRNQREQAIAKRGIAGKHTTAEKIANAPARIILGKKGYDKLANHSLKELQAKRQRIESGKKNLWDKIDEYQNFDPIALAVTVQDHRNGV
jgi:hypothetical protein